MDRIPLPSERLDWRCSGCGYTRGAHSARTYQCPISSHAFTRFYIDRYYVPKEKGPMKQFECTVENVSVTGQASEMSRGDYWVTASIAGGLTYGFVLMRCGTTKTPKYKCTQAVRLAPRTGKSMKGETPVDILGYVGTVDKVFAHVIETLVEFSDDSRTK